MGRRLRTVTFALPLALRSWPPAVAAAASTELPAGPAGRVRAVGTRPRRPRRLGGDPALAAYLRFWDAVVAANRAADPSLAALRTAAADPELSRVRETVSRNKIQKLSLRGDVGHAPQPAKVAGTTATIEDCYDISAWNPVRLDTGQPVEADRRERHRPLPGPLHAAPDPPRAGSS